MAFAAFLAYLVFVLIRPQEFIPALHNAPVVRVALICAALLQLLQKNKRYDGPQSVFLLFLLVVIFVSAVLNGWVGGGIFSSVEMLTTAVLPFFIVVNAVSTRAKLVATFVALLVAAMFMVSNSLSQVASIDGIGWAGVPMQGGNRAAYLGIFNDPNDLSMYLIMVLPLVAFLFTRASKLVKPLLIVGMVAIVYGVYLTNSRGGLLGVFALLGFWFLQRYGMAKSIALGAFVVPAALLAMSKFRAIDPDEQSASQRLEAWYEGFQMLFSNPIFGVRQGAFLDYHYLTAHNSIVLVLAELGLLGYLCWYGFVFFSTLGPVTLWNKKIGGLIAENAQKFDRDAGRALTYSMLAFAVTGFFLSRSYSPILYIFCGLMVASFYIAVPREPGGRSITLREYSGVFVATYFGSIITVYLVAKIFL